MEAIIVVLVYFVLAIVAIVKVKQKSSGSDNLKQSVTYRNATPRQVARVQRPVSNAVGTKPVASKADVTSKGISRSMVVEDRTFLSMEDRKGDWLAKQRNEERILGRQMSAMFQLREEHQSQCEAELIRQFHEVHCESDDIDTAEKAKR